VGELGRWLVARWCRPAGRCPLSRSVDDRVDDAAAARFAADHADRPECPLAVVIAAYNEEAGVGAVLGAVPRQVLGLATDVIVVVDGATDGTADAARRAGAMVCDVAVNRGQGAALRLGYRLAR